jgi:hypothetical protein
MKPSPDGIKRSRWAVVRNTYVELRDTSMKTWLHWFDEEHFGPFNRQTMEHRIRYKGAELEVIFRALDRPSDVKKLLSLELTGAWVNEAREIPFGIIQGLDDCIGRYNLEAGHQWHGMILDTNPPDDTHWWYRLSEIERPDKQYWEFFKQPGGLIEIDGEYIENEEAENIENLRIIDPHYYKTRSIGKTKDHIKVYYCNTYGFIVDGKPVHEEYNDAFHCAHEPLRPTPGLLITVGIDFGLTPAAAFGQRQTNGSWYVFDEITTEHMGTMRFADLLGPRLNQLKNQGFDIEIYGDPAGSQESQTDEQTPFKILQAKGIMAQPAYHNNDPIIRREALYKPLTRIIDGKPGFVLSPSCKMLRKALQGGYCFKKMAVAGEERYQEKPYKNQYSHIAEAAEYMVVGAGEAQAVVGDNAGDNIDMSGFYEPVFTPDGQGWMI